MKKGKCVKVKNMCSLIRRVLNFIRRKMFSEHEMYFFYREAGANELQLKDNEVSLEYVTERNIKDALIMDTSHMIHGFYRFLSDSAKNFGIYGYDDENEFVFRMWARWCDDYVNICGKSKFKIPRKAYYISGCRTSLKVRGRGCFAKGLVKATNEFSEYDFYSDTETDNIPSIISHLRAGYKILFRFKAGYIAFIPFFRKYEITAEEMSVLEKYKK